VNLKKKRKEKKKDDKKKASLVEKYWLSTLDQSASANWLGEKKGF